MGWKLASWIALVLVALGGCTPSFPERYRGPPEEVVLYDKPFPRFTRSDTTAARRLWFDFLARRNNLLADPAATLQDFAQLEWLANELKGTYVYISPGGLIDVLEARDAIREALNVPAALTVSEAIRNYAYRAETLSEGDRRLLADRRERLIPPMIKAGNALRRFVDAHEPSQQDNEILLPEGRFDIPF